MKAIKSNSDNDSDQQKGSPGFSGKNRGVTPSVAAPGVTHPSDATVSYRKDSKRRQWLRPRSFKVKLVNDVSANRKPVCDFLLLNNAS